MGIPDKVVRWNRGFYLVIFSCRTYSNGYSKRKRKWKKEKERSEYFGHTAPPIPDQCDPLIPEQSDPLFL